MATRRPGGETPLVGSEMVGSISPKTPAVYRGDETPTDFLDEDTLVRRGGMETEPGGLRAVETKKIEIPFVECRFDVRTYKDVPGWINQDAVLVDHEHGLFAVCDGLGGYGGGDKASAMAVQLLKEVYGEIQNTYGDEWDMPKKIRQTLSQVNIRLLQWRKEMKKPVKGRKHTFTSELLYPDAATTFAGIFLEKGEGEEVFVYTANIGDSRVYRYSATEKNTECVSLDDGAAFSMLSKYPQDVVRWMVQGDDDMREPLFKDKDERAVSSALRHFMYDFYVEQGAISPVEKQRAWQNYFSRLRDVPTIEPLREAIATSSLDEVIERVVQVFLYRQSNIVDACIPSERLDVEDSSIHVRRFSAQPGDRFLLVTDGITDLIPDHDVHLALSSDDLVGSVSLLHEAVRQQYVAQEEFAARKKSGESLPAVRPMFKHGDDANSVIVEIPRK